MTREDLQRAMGPLDYDTLVKASERLDATREQRDIAIEYCRGWVQAFVDYSRNPGTRESFSAYEAMKGLLALWPEEEK